MHPGRHPTIENPALAWARSHKVADSCFRGTDINLVGSFVACSPPYGHVQAFLVFSRPVPGLMPARVQCTRFDPWTLTTLTVCTEHKGQREHIIYYTSYIIGSDYCHIAHILSDFSTLCPLCSAHTTSCTTRVSKRTHYTAVAKRKRAGIQTGT